MSVIFRRRRGRIIKSVSTGPEFLDGIAGLLVCMQVDATKTASYGGTGQTLANVTVAPSDSTSQTGYDFFLGADGSVDTDDPTFTGSAGTDSAFFAHDGADFFKSKGTVMTAVNKAHRTDYTDGSWGAIAFRTAAVPAGADELMGNRVTGTERFSIGMDGAEKPDLTVRGAGTAQILTNPNILAGSTDFLVIHTWDTSLTGSDNMKLYLNGDTPDISAEKTFNVTTTDNTNGMALCARVSGTAPVDSGFRFYGAAFGQGFLTNALAASIRTWYNDNHAQTY